MSVTRLRSSVTLLVVAALSVAAAVVSPAANALPTPPVITSHMASQRTPFCAAPATPVGAPAPPRASYADCFSTRGAALAKATGNPAYARMSEPDAVKAQLALVRSPSPDMPPAAGSEVTATATSQQLLSIDFEHAYYEGQTIYWYGVSGGCSTQSYRADYMPSGWDRRVSSALLVASGNCNHNFHYDGQSAIGNRVDCTYGMPQTCEYIGDFMNDKTLSEVWTL